MTRRRKIVLWALGLAAGGWVLWRVIKGGAPGLLKTSSGDAATPPGQGTRLVVDGTTLVPIEFAHDEDWITGERSRQLLNQVYDFLLANPSVRLEIQGHTSEAGSDAYNLSLSQRRADNVREYLVAAGVAPERLTAVGVGETFATGDPVVDRHVEFVIL